MPDLQFYLGTYTPSGEGGIHHVVIAGTSAESARSRLVAEARNPSWIAMLPDRRTLLAVEEVDTADGAQLRSFRFGGAGLEPLASILLPGSYPCHIGIHPTLPLAVTAHYGDGSAALWQIEPETGRIELLQRLQLTGSGPNPGRQQGSHAHFAIFLDKGRRLALADLGGDAVQFFDLKQDTGFALVERQRLDLPPGSGPRHIAAGENFLYLACELDERVYVIEAKDDAYTVRDHIAPLEPVDGDGAISAIRLSPDGKFLYVAGRNQNAIAWMVVGADGGLRACGQVDCGGRQPRDMALDPTGQYLLVANQGSDRLSMFEIDRSTGRPMPVAGQIAVGSPACICFSE